ncbi:hypothetical protein B0A69_18505 [Chryseobacterium shigense]|uniref:Uncharacterized protein n=1 Tax=Chryseobacterium shigense TaxID=297244 RepID=A0A1N7K2E1_9FLAO|nr:hypothetical protein [Chryseobacterium shigense]PQA91073.1 hypothetical protein B0A69_18505 [Chryseobacterium shigense]SIS55727.1 hypothetical protein SAMN05421639_10824 [Chryseobacterium shigense]
MGSIYTGIIFVFFILTILLPVVVKQKKINFYIPFTIYVVLLTGYFVKVGHDFKEYNSYNHEIFSNVTGVVIDNQVVIGEKCHELFEELKFDEFTWVNHPVKRKEYFVTVYTKQRPYKFKIWDTYNQGVLVFRINKKGKEFVTNRNDQLIYYLDKSK